jgi:nitrate/nitrite transporter NarK
MNEHLDATLKGKVYFYGLIILGLLVALLGQNLNAIFPITGTPIEQMLETDRRYLYVAVAGAIVYLVLTIYAIYIAVQTYKYKQYPPPNMHVPFRHKIKPISKPYKIWLCLSLYIFGFVSQIVLGLHTSYESHQLTLELIDAIKPLNQQLHRTP